MIHYNLITDQSCLNGEFHLGVSRQVKRIAGFGQALGPTAEHYSGAATPQIPLGYPGVTPLGR